MAFERRSTSGAAYFYLSVRDRATGKVKKVYVGRGPQADAVAADLDSRRRRRAAERQAIERAGLELRPVGVLMAALDEATAVLMEAALLAAGWHRHNYGVWRRRRKRDDHGRLRTATAGTDD